MNSEVKQTKSPNLHEAKDNIFMLTQECVHVDRRKYEVLKDNRMVVLIDNGDVSSSCSFL